MDRIVDVTIIFVIFCCMIILEAYMIMTGKYDIYPTEKQKKRG